MNKYIVVSIEEAVENNYPDAESWRREWWNKWHDFYWCLYKTDGEKPTRLVGTDNSKPEDATLVRDFKWIVEVLNDEANQK